MHGKFTKAAAWPRLAWLAMLFASLPVAIIIVPGEFVSHWPDESGQRNSWKLRSNNLRTSTAERHEQEFGHRPTTLRVYEHGWPQPFLARAVVFNCNDAGQCRKLAKPWLGVTSWFLHWGGSRILSVSWSSYDVWPLYADGWIVNSWGLVVDCAVAAALIMSVGASTSWWLSSRGDKLCKFQLRDLLLVVTFLACCLGVYGYHSRIRIREKLSGKWLPPGFTLCEGHMSVSQNYCGPIWLKKLSGNHYFPQIFHHVTHATIRDNDQWKKCYDELLCYPFLHTLHCSAEVPIAAISTLQRCGELKSLHFNFKTKPRQSFTNTAETTINVSNLYLLERLQLETVKLSGDQIQAQHIEQVAALPKLWRLTLEGVSASDESIATIQKRFPSVVIEILPDWERMLGSRS